MNAVWKRPLSLALALALGACLISGCSKGGDASSSEPETPAAPAGSVDLSQVTDPYLTTAGIPGDTVVARAGEYDITADLMLYWLNYGIELYLSQAGAAYDDPVDWNTEADGETLGEFLVNSALETAAFYRLVPEICAKEGLSLSQEDLDSIETIMTDSEEQVGGAEQMDYVLWYQLLTREQYKSAATAATMFQQLEDRYFGEDSGNYPTDAEVRAYVQDELGYYRVKHILLTTVEDDRTTPLSDIVIAEKKALAEDLLSQLRAAPDPIALFDELMQEYSEDPGLAFSPDGYEAYPGQMVPEFEEASLALRDGEISGIVESSFGYHIILRLPMEDLEEFRSTLIVEKMEQVTRGWLEEYPTQLTEAWDRVDLESFRQNVLALQDAVETELRAQQEGGVG